MCRRRLQTPMQPPYSPMQPIQPHAARMQPHTAPMQPPTAPMQLVSTPGATARVAHRRGQALGLDRQRGGGVGAASAGRWWRCGHRSRTASSRQQQPGLPLVAAWVAYGYSLGCLWLQPGLPMVTAWVAYGYSLGRLWLQAGSSWACATRRTSRSTSPSGGHPFLAHGRCAPHC